MKARNASGIKPQPTTLPSRPSVEEPEKIDTYRSPDGFERTPRRWGATILDGAKSSSSNTSSHKNPARTRIANLTDSKSIRRVATAGAGLAAVVTGQPETNASDVMSAHQLSLDPQAATDIAANFLADESVTTDDASPHTGLSPELLAKTKDVSQLEAWKKTTEKNGASAAVIKAATDCFGKADVFSQINKAPNGDYTVKLRNGDSVSITAGELADASRASKFAELGEGKDVDFANLCFSVMAKSCQEKMNHQSFEAAINDLNQGEWPTNCARYLGIPTKNIETMSTSNLGQHSSAVAWGRTAVMVDYRTSNEDANSGKHVYDNSGKPADLNRSSHPDALRFVSDVELKDRYDRLNESLKDSLKRHPGITPDLIKPTNDSSEITAWRQTSPGNCASIATIKAAVDCYGKHQVFEKITKSESGNYTVELQNGRTVKLSAKELAEGTRRAAFREQGDSGDTKFASFAFTVMAKENMRISGFRNLSSAISDLNDGEDPYKCVSYLGIPKSRIETLTRRSKTDKDSIVAWNSAHAVMVNETEDGKHLYDSYGKPRSYTGSRYPMAFRFLPLAPQ